jgi:hypothetical protein
MASLETLLPVGTTIVYMCTRTWKDTSAEAGDQLPQACNSPCDLALRKGLNPETLPTLSSR